MLPVQMNAQKRLSGPNIVLIIAESMDGRKMGCMGHAASERSTPNLDALARRGVLFTNAYSTCPVCNPARASIWSGKYPHFYECWNNHEGLKEHIPTFRTILDQAGYLTSAIGPLDYTHGKHSIRDRIGSWTARACRSLRTARPPVSSRGRSSVASQIISGKVYLPLLDRLIHHTPEYLALRGLVPEEDHQAVCLMPPVQTGCELHDLGGSHCTTTNLSTRQSFWCCTVFHAISSGVASTMAATLEHRPARMVLVTDIDTTP